MIDIVKRLRESEQLFQRTDPSILRKRMLEAADEIERLRNASSELVEAADGGVCLCNNRDCPDAGELRRLARELREALAS